MNTLRQAYSLWKSEKQNKSTSLQRRLSLFFGCATVCLILTFTMLLLIFGYNGREEKAVSSYIENELEHISGAVYNDFGMLSVDGIGLGESIVDSCDFFFAENGITAGSLKEHPELLQPLLAEQMSTLLNVVNTHSCGGAFLLLDATVSPQAEKATTNKAGIFIKKTQPTSTKSVGVKYYYLRGPAQIARDSGVELIGQWKMEYDIEGETFFTQVMDTARENVDLPLSRLYYWSGRVTLKGNSEAGFLLCVPLRDAEGTVFGVCGIEVSDRMFKQLYSPTESDYENVFAIAAPTGKEQMLTSQGMVAGNYYLTGTRMSEDLGLAAGDGAFERFEGGERVYGGKSKALRLYPEGSPYEGEQWAVAVLMPEEQLGAAVRGNFVGLFIIVGVLMLLSLAASVLISRYYLRPVTSALNSIRANELENGQSSAFVEIADLFDFLAQKDKEHEAERMKLEQERQSAQTQLSRLADRQLAEIDPDAYGHFRSQLCTLTPKEREVFDLYLEGKGAKEIISILNFSENALKFHNKNIYSKLEVSSRKELLRYAALLKQEKA